jgi:glycosyltransferase involved in cell wall biosynthesis
MKPFFSVILCTYNRAHLLPNALESLLRQTEQSWEAVIVDDGSTDNTFALAQEFMRQHSNHVGMLRAIRYVAHTNRGVGFSRTTGLYAAFGTYCTFLDSDDEYLPNHLSSRRAVLEMNPTVDILHGGVEIIGDPFVTDRFDPTRRIHISQCVIEGTMVLRREAALRIGAFGTERYGEGAAFMERALQAGLHVMHVDTPTYRYDRTTPDSLCTTAFQPL